MIGIERNRRGKTRKSLGSAAERWSAVLAAGLGWLVLGLAPAACAQTGRLAAASAVWATYHGDAGLTGCVDTRLPDTPSQLWKFKTGASVSEPPVGGNGIAIFVNDDSEVFAVNDLGAKRWSRRIRIAAAASEPTGSVTYATVRAPPFFARDLVVIGSMEGAVYALDAGSGAARWTYDAGALIQGTANGGAAGDPRVVLVTQPEGVLHCLRLVDGQRLWQSEPTGRTDGHPGVAGGRVVLGNCNATVYAFAMATGAPGAAVDLGEDAQVAGGVAAVGNTAWAGTRSGELACVDLSAEKILWTVESGTGELFTTPAVGPQYVVFAAEDGIVHCVTREAGRGVWNVDLKSGAAESPVIAGDKVAVSAGGKLFLLAAATGRILWSAPVSDEITSPAIIDGMILVGADDGTVTAFGSQEPPARRSAR